MTVPARSPQTNNVFLGGYNPRRVIHCHDPEAKEPRIVILEQMCLLHTVLPVLVRYCSRSATCSSNLLMTLPPRASPTRDPLVIPTYSLCLPTKTYISFLPILPCLHSEAPCWAVQSSRIDLLCLQYSLQSRLLPTMFSTTKPFGDTISFRPCLVSQHVTNTFASCYGHPNNADKLDFQRQTQSCLTSGSPSVEFLHTLQPLSDKKEK